MYGLVLEGGGSKGVYQIGAYRAIKELGLKIRYPDELRYILSMNS